VVPAQNEEEDPQNDYDKLIEEQGGLEEDDSFYQGALRNSKPQKKLPPCYFFANRFPDIVDGNWGPADEENFEFYYNGESDHIDRLQYYGCVTEKQHTTWRLARESRLLRASGKGPVPQSKFKVAKAEESDAES
jgi:hypothetical protein